MQVAPKGALMTSQLRHNFRASQTVHGADDVMTPHFHSQVNSMSVCGPQADTLIYYNRLECPTLCIRPNENKCLLLVETVVYRFTRFFFTAETIEVF